MNEFRHCTSTTIIFGKNAENQTAPTHKKLWRPPHILSVWRWKHRQKRPFAEQLPAIQTNKALSMRPLEGPSPIPHWATLKPVLWRRERCRRTSSLGIGGGSSLDTAKAIAHGLANPDADLWQFWSKEKTLQATTPMGAILTIPAAGSEMSSDSAVLTNEQTGRKCGLTSQLNRPLFAILNPALAATLPTYQIGCGVADILMHTLDRYFVPNPEDGITDALAEALLRTVIHYGPLALKNPADYKAMSEIMWCGSLSHNGLTGLGNLTEFACHQLGHALSAKYGVAHGASLTAIWGSWARFVYWENPQQVCEICQERMESPGWLSGGASAGGDFQN